MKFLFILFGTGLITWFVSSSSSTEKISGSLSGSYTINTGYVTNKFDSLNYYYKYCYDTGLTSGLPILVAVTGWNGVYTQIDDTALKRFASYKALAVTIEHKQGSMYAGEINVYSVKQIIDSIRKNIDRSSKTRAAITGYSAGGGYALNAASRFPEMFGLLIDNFGMSDYGYSDYSSWYITNNSFASDLDILIGSPRQDSLAKYMSILSRNSISNFKGKIYIFHDIQDGLVSIQQTDTMLFENPGLNYIINTTNIGDSPRWLHQYPIQGANIIQSEIYWKDEIPLIKKQNLDNSGKLTVNGWVEIDNFSLFVGDSANRSCKVYYDKKQRNYAVVPTFENGETSMKIKLISLTDTINTIITDSVYYNL